MERDGKRDKVERDGKRDGGGERSRQRETWRWREMD